MLLVINFKGIEVPFSENDIAFKITVEIKETKHQFMLRVLLPVVSALLGIIICPFIVMK